MANWLPENGRRSPPVLDQRFLERVAGLVGRLEMRERLIDGLLELSDCFEQLHDQLHTGRIDGLATTAQEIAAIAGHLGLSQLAAVAADAARRARSPDVTVTEVATPLLAVRDEALAALSAHGADLPAGCSDR